MSKRGSYLRIAEDVRERIQAGQYPPGSAIPSYRQLSRLHGVSITTAQAAVRLLRTLGLVYGVPGRGVFVTGRPAGLPGVVVPDAAALAEQLQRRRGAAAGGRAAAVATVVPGVRRPSVRA